MSAPTNEKRGRALGLFARFPKNRQECPRSACADAGPAVAEFRENSVVSAMRPNRSLTTSQRFGCNRQQPSDVSDSPIAEPRVDKADPQTRLAEEYSKLGRLDDPTPVEGQLKRRLRIATSTGGFDLAAGTTRPSPRSASPGNVRRAAGERRQVRACGGISRVAVGHRQCSVCALETRCLYKEKRGVAFRVFTDSKNVLEGPRNAQGRFSNLPDTHCDHARRSTPDVANS